MSDLFSLLCSLQIPSPVSSLAFGRPGHLFVGSDDGTLRIYYLSTLKVLKAIKSIGVDISSIICIPAVGTQLEDVWLACGRRIFQFEMASTAMVLSRADAVSALDLGDDEEDCINELSLSANGKHIAFSLDSGVVGIIDLSSKEVSRMKSKHGSICGSVKFIPDRPQEIVSGGYDYTLLHFDFQTGNILSRFQLPPPSQIDGTILSPPFIVSTALSRTGIVAAGAADGRLWLGMGGEKTKTAARKKRSRKWEGLRDYESFSEQVAQGPIAALAFTGSSKIVSCTLLGVLTCQQIHSNSSGVLELKSCWTKSPKKIQKVNSMISSNDHIAVGGFGSDGKGYVEVWLTAPEDNQEKE